MTFPEFWSAYPRKSAKKPAERLYECITSGGITVRDKTTGMKVLLQATHEELIHGAREYAREVSDRDQRHILLASTWLHNEHWADYAMEVVSGETAVLASLWGEITALEDKKVRAVLNEIETARLESLREQIEAIKGNVVKLHG